MIAPLAAGRAALLPRPIAGVDLVGASAWRRKNRSARDAEVGMASNHSRYKLRLAGAALAASVALAACGSDDGEQPAKAPASSPSATPARVAASLEVTEVDFAIRPAHARIRRAGSVRFDVVNRGQSPHALAIETPGGVVRTKTLAAGERGSVEADLDAGTYTWFCPVGDHRVQGMEGEFAVGSGGEAEPEASGGGGGGGGGYGY